MELTEKETAMKDFKYAVYELYMLCHDENDDLDEEAWDECLIGLQNMLCFMEIDKLICEVENAV